MAVLTCGAGAASATATLSGGKEASPPVLLGVDPALPEPQPASAAQEKAERTRVAGIERVMGASGLAAKVLSKFGAKAQWAPWTCEYANAWLRSLRNLRHRRRFGRREGD